MSGKKYVHTTRISIHAPREGSDEAKADVNGNVQPVFQSTLPVRGATYLYRLATIYMTISIHAPREGSDEPFPAPPSSMAISIHAPREGSDCMTYR